MVDDTAGYPTTVITKIYQGVQSTGVPFSLSTGDYIFAYAAAVRSAWIEYDRLAKYASDHYPIGAEVE